MALKGIFVSKEHLWFLINSKILKILHTEISNGNMSIQKVFRQCESFYGESKQIFVKKFFRILHMEMASPRCVFVNVSLKKKSSGYVRIEFIVSYSTAIAIELK